ncbi:hypothetical protein FBU31_002845 [Coemansia sp. 'formosensis']|nr:hypothetical protein FBU31_002845 [Coemansia sp. 'formosensis']
MICKPLFQALPMLVVEKIGEYLEGRHRAWFDDDIDRHNEKKWLLHPLFSISDVWREAVLASICDNCKIVLTTIEEFSRLLIQPGPRAFRIRRATTIWSNELS